MRFFPFSLRPNHDDNGPHYADIYARAVAAGIDLGIIFLLLSDLFQVMSATIFSHVDRATLQQVNSTATIFETFQMLWVSHFVPLWILNMTVQVTIIGALLIATQAIWGHTPGKWLLGLKVARVNSMEPLSLSRQMLRFFAYIPAILPFMIGIFWMSFNRERRGWHDYIAGSVVINTRPYGWYRNKLKAGFRFLLSKIRERKSASVK
jgi:RDD family